MKNFLHALIAIAAGALTGAWMINFPAVHEVAGRLFQRGRLIALLGQRGIFQADLSARAREKQFCAGRSDEHLDAAEKIAFRDELIATEALPANAAKFGDSEATLATLRRQFADDHQFRATLRRSGVSQWALKGTLAETLRREYWIENRIAAQVGVSDTEVRKYFEQHQDEFRQSLWIRARHIF